MSNIENIEYRGHQPRTTAELRAWQDSVPQEAALDPQIPIIDAHHHIWGKTSDEHFYTIADYHRDIDAGHNVIGSVYIEARQVGWYTDGPEEMRPAGEVGHILSIVEAHQHKHTEVAAGMVTFADLSFGDKIAPVLEAQIAASKGRMRGVRQGAGFLKGKVASPIRPREHLLMEPSFRQGLSHFERLNLSFDAWVIYDQIHELIDLVDAFPRVSFVVNHLGAPLGAAEYRPRRQEIFAEWKKGMSELAKRQNVFVKIGGLGMTMYGFAFENRDRPPSSQELQSAWQPYVSTAVEIFGASRCLMESNFPPDKQTCGFNELWNALKLTTRSLSRDERAALFYRTAASVYRLPGLAARGDAAMPK